MMETITNSKKNDWSKILNQFDEIFEWYQGKIGNYDKQSWEQSVEQRILTKLEHRPKKVCSLNAELIDVDLVRGSAFSKAKPQNSWRARLGNGITRVLFMPLCYKFWEQHTSVNIARMILIHYGLQLLQLLLFLCQDVQEVASAEVFVPICLALALGVLHAQIVSPHGPKKTLPKPPFTSPLASSPLPSPSLLLPVKKGHRGRRRSPKAPSSRHPSGKGSPRPAPPPALLTDHVAVNPPPARSKRSRQKEQSTPPPSPSTPPPHPPVFSLVDENGVVQPPNRIFEICKPVVVHRRSLLKCCDPPASEESPVTTDCDELRRFIDAKNKKIPDPVCYPYSPDTTTPSTAGAVTSPGNPLKWSKFSTVRVTSDEERSEVKTGSSSSLNRSLTDPNSNLQHQQHFAFPQWTGNTPSPPQYIDNSSPPQPMPNRFSVEGLAVNKALYTDQHQQSSEEEGTTFSILTDDANQRPEDLAMPLEVSGSLLDPVVGALEALLEPKQGLTSRGTVQETSPVYVGHQLDRPTAETSPGLGFLDSMTKDDIDEENCERRSESSADEATFNKVKFEKLFQIRSQRANKSAPIKTAARHVTMAYDRCQQYESSAESENDREELGDTLRANSAGHKSQASETEYDRMNSDVGSTESSSAAEDAPVQERVADPSTSPEDPFVMWYRETHHGGLQQQQQLSTTQTISCYIWEGSQLKKLDLTLLDIGWSIIQAVERHTVDPDYIRFSFFSALLLSVMPVLFRLFDRRLLLAELPNYYHQVPALHTLLVDLPAMCFVSLFSDKSMTNCIVLLGILLRLSLYTTVAFLLCVAERTFEQRLQYAKHFCYLTSSRRARKYYLPHFRLNKVCNIKFWLSLRSYLKKRGPQRSADSIVTAAFYLIIALASFLCGLIIQASSSVFRHILCWDLVACSVILGLALLRFLSLGTKITKKYRNLSVLITEQINLYLAMEKKPHKKEELHLANNVLKLAEVLLKEVDGPFRVCGWSINPFVYNILKVVVLSACSTVMSQYLGFKLKLYKIKLNPTNW